MTRVVPHFMTCFLCFIYPLTQLARWQGLNSLLIHDDKIDFGPVSNFPLEHAGPCVDCCLALVLGPVATPASDQAHEDEEGRVVARSR